MNKRKISLLTDKELEIMQLFMLGQKNEQISRRLNTSIYSICKIYKSVIKKFNVKNKIQAACIIANETKDNNIAKEFLEYRSKIEKPINISLSIDFNFKFS